MAGKGGFLSCDFDECSRGGGEQAGDRGEMRKKHGKEYGRYSFRADEKSGPEMCYNV